MRRSVFVSAAFFGILFCGLISQAFPQSVTGLPAFGTFQGGGIDTVNTNNLNVNVNIPLYHKAGRGVPVNFSFGYDSSVWSLGYNSTTQKNYWIFNAGQRFWPLTSTFFGTVSDPGTPMTGPCSNQKAYFPSYTDPVGTVHTFQLYIFPPGPCGGSLTATLPGTDGYTMLMSHNNLTVYDRSGNALGKDTNGNSIATLGSTVVDTLGMTALTEQFTQVNGTTQTYTYNYTGPGSGNPQEPITITLTQLSVASSFSCTNSQGAVTDYPPTPTYLVSSISMADGTSYGFKYEAIGQTGNTTGRLSELDLPTGGNIKYTYTKWPGTSAMCTDGSPAAITRTTSDGSEWQYSRNATGTVTTITDPATNQTSYTFSAASTGYETQRVVKQGSSTTLETFVTCYNGNFSNCASTNITGGTVIREKDVYRTPINGKTALSETFFNSSGLLTQDNEFDFGINTGAAPTGSPLRAEMIAYATPLSGSYVNDRPFCIEITAGSSPTTCGTVASNTTSLTLNSYDSLASGSVSLGNLTQVQNWVAGTSYLTKSFSYASNGLLQTTTDVNSTQTTYIPQNCNNNPAFISTITSASLATTLTWDCNGGVVTQVSDANNQPTQYGYDVLWRATSVTDPLNNVTNTVYTPATSTTPPTIETSLNFPIANPTSTVDTLYTLDGLGRRVESQRKTTPGGTSYDSAVSTGYGWKTTGSVLGQFTTQTVPGGTALTTTQFDVLGRPASVTDGGGGTVTNSYPQNDVLRVVGPQPANENLKQRQIEYDALGRVTSVCELTAATGSGPCQQAASTPNGFFTKYTYDSPANSVSVSQNAQGTAQSRSYQYDGLHRLTSESNPESGAVTYLYDSTTQQDACTPLNGRTSNGDLLRKNDANGYVCYEYDALHRLTTVANSAANTQNPCKHFNYDNTQGVLGTIPTGVSITNTLGRLAEAETDTCASPITAASILTDEWFSYSARGETSDVYESTVNSAGYYHTTASYWANGALNTLSGVPGLNGWAFGLDGEARNYSATYGASTKVVKTTTYYPSSAQTTVSFGSGTTDTDVYGFDQNTGRMNSFKFTDGSGQTSLSATLGWNANGTLGSLGITDQFNPSNTQSCSYTYDDLDRLAGKDPSGYTVDCGSGGFQQLITLDPFGNISKSGTSSFVASYLLSNQTTNNQEQSVGSCGPTYDGTGNLTKDCTNNFLYAWNVYHNPTTMNGVSLTYDALDREVQIGTSTEVLYSPIGKLGLMNGQSAKAIRIPLPGGSIAELLGAGGGQTHILHSDWLGTARLSTLYTNRSSTYDTAYAPYGENYAGSGGSTSDLDFTGQFQDSLAGEYDFLFRKYSPVQGRWLTRDPAGLSVVDFSNPQSWNRYAYVDNNPLSATDPLGLDCYWWEVYKKGDCSSAPSVGYAFGSNWTVADIISNAYSDPYEAIDRSQPWTVVGDLNGQLVIGGCGDELGCTNTEIPALMTVYPHLSLLGALFITPTRVVQPPHPPCPNCHQNTGPYRVTPPSQQMTTCDKMEKQGEVVAFGGAAAEGIALGLDAGGITLPAGVSVHAAGGAAMLTGTLWAGMGGLGTLVGACQP